MKAGDPAKYHLWEQLFSLFEEHFFPSLFHSTVYFSFHFILRLPLFFHLTSLLFPPSQGQALHRLVQLVSLAHIVHTITCWGANIHSDTYLLTSTEGSLAGCLTDKQEKKDTDKQAEEEEKKEADKEQGLTGGMCIPLACLALEWRRHVAGCSVYYPQAIWVGRLTGCGGIH